jgi:hypothetical protein
MLLADGGFRRTPMRTRISASASNATGWIAGESKPRPLSSLTLHSAELKPVTAAAVLVLTRELARSANPGATALIERELRNAVGAVVDEKFFDLLIDTSTVSIPSSGNTTDDVRVDLRALLNAVNTTEGDLFFCAASDVAKSLSAMEWPYGNVGPQGGELMQCPLIVSPAIPAGTLRLVNASAIAADAGLLTLRGLTAGDVEMSNTPGQDAGSGAGAQMVSLFQTDSVGLLASVEFAVEAVLSNASAQLTGVTWGAA